MDKSGAKNKKMVSIVTVTFNCLEQLKTTAQNVLSMDYPDMEYIIIDGASTDGTAQYAEQLSQKDSRVKSFSEPDQGIFDAMNKGVRNSTGEWVCFMNAGDMFASKDVLMRIFCNPTDGYDIIYGDVIKNGHVKKAEKPHNSHRMFFCHQSCLTRRTCLENMPFDINRRLSADFKFVKQAYNNDVSFLQVHFPIAIFDTSGVSNTLRSKGLYENIQIVMETDNIWQRIILLPRLVIPFILCKLRNK